MENKEKIEATFNRISAAIDLLVDTCICLQDISSTFGACIDSVTIACELTTLDTISEIKTIITKTRQQYQKLVARKEELFTQIRSISQNTK